MPKEETFPIPLNHVDVTRTTCTNLDVLQERFLERRRGSKFIRFMDRIHEIHFWKRKNLPQDTCGSESAVRRSKQLPEIWSGMSNAAQKKEKEDWAMEKLKVDNARRLRGIYFIDPEDGEREKRSHQKREEKLEILMEAAMLCKTGTKKCLKKLR